MYLQSLEMVGFKSFAPKTTLQFHPGVTAIVGPNGCGKSNVLDALRWVLGEQSAKALRGGEMADVIFSGTDSRQPLGMAEVSLTFSDCEKELGVEWNEVRLTRRVYRDGKSEYFLNKAPCRLRDIHGLFMDTGIGRSAYSIMEQGKIDAILSSRPEDRRAIFEEAAGITRYKAQKKEALRKLEYTEANLLRVADIMKEVKRQIGSLQRQAAKARRYQALMADLRTFDTHLSFRNFSSLRDDLRVARQELEGSGDARAARERDIDDRESALAAIRSDLGALDARIAATRENIQDHKNKISSAENRVATNAERADEARATIARSRLEIAAGEEKIREQENQIARTDEMLAEILGLLRSGEEALAAAQDRFREAREARVDAERALHELGSEAAALEVRIHKLRGDASGASARREAAVAKLGILRSEEVSARESADEATARAAAARSRAESLESGLASAEQDLDEAQTLCDDAQKERQAREAEWNAASRTLSEHESKLDVLRQLDAAGEGLGEGTQAVLRGLDDPDLVRPAVLGALASLVEVDGAHIPAIEAALGANLQAIVFKDASVAESAAKMLAAGDSGRAALLPREWLEAPASTEPAPPCPDGALGWAKDFVRPREGCGDAARRLLAGIAVTESLETAFALKAAHPSVGFATLQGDFISREGVVSAGKAGDTGASVLVRRNQIAALESDADAARRELDAASARRESALDVLSDSQERVQAAREAVQEAGLALASARSELAQAERHAAEAAARQANFERESAALAEAAETAAATASALESEIAEADGRLRQTRARQSEAQAAIETARERERAASDELNDLRVRVATERQQQENLARQRGPMAERVAELADLLAKRGQDIAGAETRISGFDAESARLRESVVTWQTILETGEAEVAGLVEQRAEAVVGCERAEAELRQARHALNDLQEARARLEVRASQLEMRIENVASHIATRYHLALEEFRPDRYGLLSALREREKRARQQDAPAQSDSAAVDAEAEAPIASVTPPAAEADPPAEATPETDEIPWDRIELLVAELTEKLDSMGPVNLEAIQEYDELEERHRFLEQQNTDLVNSKAELLEVIAKINKTTRELFADTFEKVRENFRVMFTELFAGGNANLVLADESDPLECGIEIIAKPPGKQLQSISLLSGGERTMTAVALLFAIYMVKPSPFCVLDEMDAPLDESNISRFIKILDRFVSQSQFVVITHNKRTIARADTVFGVTMEEHGISKVVSVKFHARPDDPAAPAASGPRTTSVAEAFGKSGNLLSERPAPATESALTP